MTVAVALVTGATSGIGHGIAAHLADIGWSVVSASRGPGDGAPPAATHIRADVGDDASVRALADQIGRAFGRLDLVVNNSGTGPQIPHEDLEAAAPGVWQDILGVNLLGPWRIIAATRELLARSDQGHVVNIASIAGIGPRGSSIPYSVSKAGLIHLTKLLARALAPQIRVNAIAPGWIDSPRNLDWPIREQIREAVPLRRLGAPTDVAVVIECLQRMTYVTGETICVDGGLHLG